MTPAELRRQFQTLRMDIEAGRAALDDAHKKMLLLGSALAALDDTEIDTRIAAAKYQCPECGLGFKTERILAEHEANLEHGRGHDPDWRPPHYLDDEPADADDNPVADLLQTDDWPTE